MDFCCSSWLHNRLIYTLSDVQQNRMGRASEIHQVQFDHLSRNRCFVFVFLQVAREFLSKMYSQWIWEVVRLKDIHGLCLGQLVVFNKMPPSSYFVGYMPYNVHQTPFRWNMLFLYHTKHYLSISIWQC